MNTVQLLFSKNLKRLRVKMEYSQMKFAELADLSTGYINDLEQGRKFPSAKTMQKLTDALAVRPAKLFQDEAKSDKNDIFDLLTKLGRELKLKIDGDIDKIVRSSLKEELLRRLK